jgi:hypothetical protein
MEPGPGTTNIAPTLLEPCAKQASGFHLAGLHSKTVRAVAIHLFQMRKQKLMERSAHRTERTFSTGLTYPELVTIISLGHQGDPGRSLPGSCPKPGWLRQGVSPKERRRRDHCQRLASSSSWHGPVPGQNCPRTVSGGALSADVATKQI